MSLAFGAAAGKVGLLILFACVVGECLRATGGARAIATAVLQLFGPRQAAVGLATASFVLAVPVFFDTLFLLMLPIARALRLQSGRDYLLYILAIVAGGTMAHALVPPTPGPLFVIEALGVDLVTMMIGGSVTGIVAAAAGLLYAHRLNSHMVIPLRDEDAAAPVLAAPSVGAAWACVPIALPLLLISGATFGARGAIPWPATRGFFAMMGEKNMAIAVAAAVALGIAAWKMEGRGTIAAVLSRALQTAAPIVLIISAGGAFGEMLRQTNIAALFVGHTQTSFWLIPLTALVAAAVRTAQGSVTVAMITTVGMVAGLATSATLPFHPVYLALAIGCGAKNFAWMNDSGFWVMARTSGMTERETLRTISVMNLYMAAAGLVVVMLGAWLLPMR
ncbi:MAG: SLC13 family permease [Deltaproteobacteria bacterium]|nr:SLC13 family permease [Deltaproteobacteria bacterium]